MVVSTGIACCCPFRNNNVHVVLFVVSTGLACCCPYENNYQHVVLFVVSTGLACCCHFGNNYERIVLLDVSMGNGDSLFDVLLETTVSVLFSWLFPQGWLVAVLLEATSINH